MCGGKVHWSPHAFTKRAWQSLHVKPILQSYKIIVEVRVENDVTVRLKKMMRIGGRMKFCQET